METTKLQKPSEGSFLQPKKISIAEKVENSRLLITSPIDKPREILTIQENGFSSILMTLGNISLIQGQAKSRKTFLISFIVVALLLGRTFLKFVGSLPQDKSKIIYFDTEQGLHHCKKVQERIYKLAGLSTEIENEHIQYYHLRSYAYKERREIIDYVIRNTKNVGVVIIDGVRDLVSDINDASEATLITGFLMKMSDEYQIHILSVLHENKGDKNSRGHLGSEMQNKAESVIRVSKESENKKYSKVEPVYLRELDFNEFLFEINQDTGQPEILNRAAKKTYSRPQDMDMELHRGWIKEAFELETEFSKTKYIEQLKMIASNFDIRLGDNVLREFVDYQLEHDLIQNIGTDKNFKLTKKI